MSEPMWWETYAVVFGKRLTDQEINASEEYLQGMAHAPRQNEVVRAVKSLGEDYRLAPKKFAPTVNDIWTRLLKLRAEDKQLSPSHMWHDHKILVRGYNTEAGRSEWAIEMEPAAIWTKEIDRVKDDPVKVGNVICRPTRVEDCREREQYAKSRNINYKIGGFSNEQKQ